MAPHSSTLAWKIPWMEEPGGLQSMGSLRVGHDWATSLWLFTFMHWRRKWQPTPVFLPGESQGRRSLMGCCHGVAQSWTRLKRLSSSSSHLCHVLFWPTKQYFWPGWVRFVFKSVVLLLIYLLNSINFYRLSVLFVIRFKVDKIYVNLYMCVSVA